MRCSAVSSPTGHPAVHAALLCRANTYAVNAHPVRCVQVYNCRVDGHGGSAFLCTGMRTTKWLTLHCDSRDDSPTTSGGTRSGCSAAAQRALRTPAAQWAAATAGAVAGSAVSNLRCFAGLCPEELGVPAVPVVRPAPMVVGLLSEWVSDVSAQDRALECDA